uniref:ATP-binding cassette sub-family B member 6 n=1 Tax=Strigamia maritima TaxID=126957 RepID=T1JKF5_STRMM
MQYCPPNITLSEVWFNHGVSQCFMETVSSIILTSFILIFGSVQHFIYFKYATRYQRNDLPRSILFKLQIVLTIVLPVLSLIRLVLQAVLLKDHVIYGYMIFAFICNSIYWFYSLSVIFLERWNILPSVPTRGHGLMILVFWTLAFINENLSFLNMRNEDWWFHTWKSLTDKVEMALFVLRYIVTFLIFLIGMKAPGLVREPTISTISHERLVEEDLENQTESQGSAFRNVCSKVRRIMPMIWPKKSIGLQLVVLVCFGLLLVQRVVNPLTPLFYKHIIDSLTYSDSKTDLLYRWDLILIYMALWSLRGNGFLSNLTSFLWIKVSQYTDRETEINLFTHLHSLALRWHLTRKTGEVLKVVDRGVQSLDTFLSYLIFNIFPTITDIIIAIVYLATAISGWFGLILFITMVIYLTVTIAITEWRTKYRREMNKLSNDMETIAVDSLLNFETVKYYTAEDYEVERYRKSILKYQVIKYYRNVSEWQTLASLYGLNTSQNIIMSAGLLSGMLLCAHMVVYYPHLTVGDFVLFVSYTLQFYQPLNYFGTYYRVIQKAFIDMENMFDLMKQKTEVKDIPDAPNLFFTSGKIEFRNVSFSYNPERQILKKINLTIQPGQTVAIVGPTGAGKSTLVRLLFRLYDVTDGVILVDGQDITKVTQKSLRQLIGVVPQDTVLFNADIRYNIRYGRVTADDKEVETASEAAEIHNAILNFPLGYETIVGERGLKLSGGEKQRVAIARTILKQPSLILLDEATSALDTQTERNIQSSLTRLCANKTTIIVAHRLSTIVHADQICVLKEGEIIESGTHDALLKIEGEYYQMWQAQQKEYKQKETKGESSNECSDECDGEMTIDNKLE